MADFDCDVVVIGAGVVGLATARAFALAGREVLVLEAAPAIGTGISSRNSEVIHAGIYYTPGSLKAAMCVAGRKLLYAYCAERGIPHARCGKLIVLAPGDDPQKLHRIAQNARANGVGDLEVLDQEAVSRLEPALRTGGGLLSPSTGIVDSHTLMLTLQGDLEEAGGTIALNTPVLSADVRDGLRLVAGGVESTEIAARLVINSAGLSAPGLVGRLQGFPAKHVPKAFYAKGNYFGFTGKTPFRHLVYPLPEAAGLGVHATLDLAGRMKFGPDVEWIDDPVDLAVDPGRAERFYAAIRTYWPGLPDGALFPDYAGVRPKLGGETSAASDFIVQDEQIHGIPGLINLLGIESPGLTSSLALADKVLFLTGRQGQPT